MYETIAAIIAPVLFSGLLWLFLSVTLLDDKLLFMSDDLNIDTTWFSIINDMWHGMVDLENEGVVRNTFGFIVFVVIYWLGGAILVFLLSCLWPFPVVFITIAIFIANKQRKRDKALKNQSKNEKFKERSVHNDDVIDDRFY